MDQSAQAQRVMQDAADGPAHNVDPFYAQLHNYANHPSHPPSEYPFAWNNTQLYATSESPAGYGHQENSWQNEAFSSQTDPALRELDQSQQNYQPGDYQQPPQPVYDHPSMIRPSPSPGVQQHYHYQQSRGYMLPYAQNHEFVQSPHPQPAQQANGPQQPGIPHPAFSPPPAQNHYMMYPSHPMPQQSFPQAPPGAFSRFRVQDPRQQQSFVDPTLLEANNFQNAAPSQFQHTFNSIQPQRVSSQAQTAHSMQHPQTVDHLDVAMQQVNGLPAAGVLSTLPADKAGKASKKKASDAPKKPRSRAKKDGIVNGTKAADDDSLTASNDEAELEVLPEPKPALLQVAAPAEPKGRAEWDTLSALWSPRNKSAAVDKIREGMASYGELLKRLRSSWESQNEALKKAELSNAPTDDLRRRVADWRQIVEHVMNKTLEWGHSSIIQKLGENHWTMLAMRAFLIDRVTATDWDGSLVHSILKVMANFDTLDQEMLDKVKMEKALARFSKKSGSEIKALVQRVIKNVAAATKQKSSAPSTDDPSVSDGPTPGNPIVLIKNSSQVAGTKRNRDDATVALPATKKTPSVKAIPEASKPLALQHAATKKSDGTRVTKADAAINGTSASRTNKSKTAATIAASKPVASVFSSLVSASKKPGTSNAARAAAAAKVKAASPAVPQEAIPSKAAPVAAPTSAPPSQARPAFSFSQTLAGLHKPKEVEEKKTEDRQDESIEDKARRLRKEARRKLRVTWRPDDTLTEVRLFTHHPDEEINHADSGMRDMNDVAGEGRMLKMHKQLDEIDEDDDFDEAEQDSMPYDPPSEVDVSDMDEEERYRNYAKTAGPQVADSPEKMAQEHREQTSLMVVYALPSDVPPSPKEAPPPSADEPVQQTLSFGEPGEEHIRERERSYQAFRASNGMTPQTNLSKIIDALGSQPATLHTQQPPMTDLERTFSQFSQLQQAQSQQQYQPQITPNVPVDLSKIVAMVQQAQNQNFVAPAPQQPAIQQAAAPDLAAIFASLNPALAFATQQQTNPNAYAGAYNSQQQPAYTSGGGINGDDYSRKHGWSNDDDDQSNEQRAKRQQLGNNGMGDKDPKQHVNYKTVVCRFWKEGKCKKGDDCTYIHD